MTTLWLAVEQALAHPGRRFVPGLGLLGLILVIDRWLLAGTHALLGTGIADETAHLSTMVIILLAIARRRQASFVVGCLVGAVAIDLDHLPLIFGSNLLTVETNRPFTHGFLTMAIVLALAVVARPPWKAAGLGVVVGLGVHFLRDMATSTAGVPLLWPLSPHGFMLPYPLYVAVLAVAVAGTVILPAPVVGDETRQRPGH